MAQNLRKLSPTDPTDGLSTEWLITNGLGGYAMGTALGVNTRRYHGLLIASTQPPVGRILALHSLIEQLEIGGETIDLSAQQFGPDLTLHPDGWQRIVRFAHRPPVACVWEREIGSIALTRTLLLHRADQVAELTWSVSGLDRPALLRLRPLTPMRDFHGLDHAREHEPAVSLADEQTLTLRRVGMEMWMHAARGRWRIEPQWWHQFAYSRDRDRGQEWVEDVWSPGVVEFELEPGSSIEVALEVGVPIGSRVDEPVIEPLPAMASPVERLRAAADQFIVRRRVGDRWVPTIIAGYPWFADWGRDTMIALPGLMLCATRFAEAKALLLAFGERVRGGLLPNVFSDYDEYAAYNTADASLWYIHAVHSYAKTSGDTDLASLLGACRAIIDGYRQGTDYAIGLCDDDLITCGDGGHPVTWMDAKRGGITFTPRDGKCVEINALWHNALLALAELTTDESERSELCAAAERTASSFREKFWWPERQCLHDVLLRDQDWRPDDALRCNQIFAVSLPFSPLTPEQQRSVVNIVRDRLLTPYGLRTLEPGDRRYQPRFEGDLMQRDGAYHNGTVWPWLIGPYGEAMLRADDFSDAARSEVRRTLRPLINELDFGCLNQLAEVYDGDPPHREAGCVAQAWSVAEVLRLMTLLGDDPASPEVV
jgi:predicted glycogen debranching enzyme